jgi:hypothetical protein
MPSQGFDDPFVWLMAEVLLPIVPAGLLYWGLPTTGETGGSLFGFTVKFGGAFAGYFAVLVLLIYKGPRPPAPQTISAQSQVWVVEGRVSYDGNALPPSTIQVSLAEAHVYPDGRFKASIVVNSGRFGDPGFPKIFAQGIAQDYGTQTIDLEDDSNKFHITRDDTHYKLNIVQPIVLEKVKQDYSPKVTAFQP